MEIKVKADWSEQILQQAFQAFRLDDIKPIVLRDYQNLVFEVQKDANPYILRFTHNLYQSPNEVRSELLWMDYLRSKGLEVPIVTHTDGQPEKVIQFDAVNSGFSAILMQKFEGQAVSKPLDLFQHFSKLGKLLAQMHNEATTFVPPDSFHRTAAFTAEHQIMSRNNGLSDPKLSSLVNTLFERFKNLTANQDNYGMIHCDVHSGNYLLHNGEFQLFDFENCGPGFFSYDIAMIFYYSKHLHSDSKNDQQAVANGFWDGYHQIRTISDTELNEIPEFMQWRNTLIYIYLLNVWHDKTLSEKEENILKALYEKSINGFDDFVYKAS